MRADAIVWAASASGLCQCSIAASVSAVNAVLLVLACITFKFTRTLLKAAARIAMSRRRESIKPMGERLGVIVDSCRSLCRSPRGRLNRCDAT